MAQRPLSNQLDGAVFRGSEAIRKGYLTSEQLRSKAWRHLFHDVYADSTLPVDHGLMCRGGGLLLPSDAVLTGLSAAWLHGVRLASAAHPVEVAIPRPHGFGPVTGMKIYTTEIPMSDISSNMTPRCTNLVRTGLHIARHYEIEEAVVALDAILRNTSVTLNQLLARLPRGRPRPWGYAKAERALSLVRVADSPQESRLRLKLVLAGVPEPDTQHEIHIYGEFIARVDLAWPDHKIAMEYDGHWHAETRQFYLDRRRLNRLTLAGWNVLFVTADRLRRDFANLVKEVLALMKSSPSSPANYGR